MVPRKSKVKSLKKVRIEFRRALKENDKDKIEVEKQSPDGKMTSRERERERQAAI